MAWGEKRVMYSRGREGGYEGWGGVVGVAGGGVGAH